MKPDEIVEQLQQHASETYDRNQVEAGQEIMKGLSKETRRLDQMVGAENPPAFYHFLQDALRKRLTNALWTKIEVGPVSNLDREEKEQLQAEIGMAVTHRRDRSVLLRTVDSLWIRHLTDLDILREGIGLRAVAQQDPLVAFQKDAHEMYGALLVQIQEDVIKQILRPVIPRRMVLVQAPRQLFTNRGERIQGSQKPIRRSGKEIGRNDPCPCGSGKKYKNCCLHKERQTSRVAAISSEQRSKSTKARKRRKRR
jgi:preprotein translocase subunit SecA